MFTKIPLLLTVLCMSLSTLYSNHPQYLHGVIVPTVTPFKDTPEKEIDFDAYTAILQRLCETCASAIFINSGTGEWPELTLEEKQKATLCAVGTIDKKKPLLVGVGSKNSLQEVASLTQWLNDFAIDAIVLPTPPFLRKEGKIPQNELLDFYVTISEISQHPLIIYDPKTDFTTETLDRLLNKSNKFIAMKFNEKTKMERFGAMVQAANGRISLLACSDVIILPAIQQGAVGVVAGSGNLYPHAVQKLLEMSKANDPQAEHLSKKLNIASVKLLRSGNLAYSYKLFMQKMLLLPIETTVRTEPASFSYFPDENDWNFILELFVEEIAKLHLGSKSSILASKASFAIPSVLR